MRIFLIVVGCMVALILGVLVIGWLLPKRHVATRSASYRAKPEQLYSLIAGPQNWRPDVLHCEAVPDAGGRDLQRETARDGGTMTYELMDGVPPTSIKRRIATENLPYGGTWTFSIQPNADVTTVRITEDGQIYNPMFRFMSRFILGYTGTIDNYLRALGKATGQEIQINN